MTLTVSSKEILALYDLLYTKFRNYPVRDDSSDQDEIALHQIYTRLRTCILSSLKNGVDPVNAFIEREEQKIVALGQQDDS